MNKTTIFLVISLMVNIFLLGYVAGNSFSSGMGHRKLARHALTKEIRKELMANRIEMFEIMTAENFDEAAFDAQVTKLDVIHNKIRKRMPKFIKSKLIGKSQEERLDFAKKLKHHAPPLER